MGDRSLYAKPLNPEIIRDTLCDTGIYLCNSLFQIIGTACTYGNVKAIAL
ncbi:hypothetical protein MKMG_02027 [Methanogenium sp. MK-MG]|nr:hypothetical protein MKMG_02027 [Methanogenium sp. MK-MG]